MSTMNAIAPLTYTSPETLRPRRIPVPAPGPGEVLIRVRAASVNPYDWHVLRGEPFLVRALVGIRRPRRPGLGAAVAGVVESLGDGATDFRPGDEVFGNAHGSFAEFAVGAQIRLATKPAAITFEQAASLPIAGVTALQALRDHGELHAGGRVLVIGAAGGVGTFAVQLAKAMGAEVTGVCSTSGSELVRSLGADRVVDYTRESFVEGGERYDLILMLAGDYGLSSLARMLVADGMLVVIGSGTGRAGRFGVLGQLSHMARAPVISRIRRRRVRTLIAKTRREPLVALADYLEAGSLTPVVDRVYPLAEAGRALLHVESGHAHGKTVLAI